MSLINFESSWKKKDEREQIREAREAVLEVAKVKGVKEAERRAKENSWMLPDLAIESSEKSKKKKKKKEKKSKKEKKKKKKSSRSSSDEWEEKKPLLNQEAPAAEERDSWMSMSSFAAGGLVSRDELRKQRDECKEAEKKAKELAKEPGRSSRELNPYFKEGGSGVPPEQVKRECAKVGDGGASWLRRAFKRAQEQAEREGKSIEEVAAQRWGSLDKFKKLLAKAEGTESPPRKRSSERDEVYDEYKRSRNDHHGDKKGKSFHRPSDHDDRYKSSRSHRESRGGGSWKSADRRDQEKDLLRQEEAERRRRRREEEEEEKEKEQKVSRDEQEQEVVLMTEKEMNSLGAKIVKAELMGNSDKAEALKRKLAQAREALKSGDGDDDGDKVETVILTATDSKGMTRPVDATARDDTRDGKRRKKGKVDTHAEGGQRVRYFADDDRYDLKQMFEREKLSTAEDQNSMMSRLAGKSIERTDDEYDIDDVFTSRAARKRSEEQDMARDREKAVAQHRKLAKTLDDCKRCFATKMFTKHLMVAVGKTCYLMLPSHTSLTQDHCLIVPMSHVKCSTLLDEDVYEEVQTFRKALVKMFQAEGGRDCVFFECAMGLKGHPHMVVECVPLPREMGDMAPMYFQKAIQECESEWAHNKKLVKLSNDRGIRRAVPKGLPYFHVDFGMQNGFAHVIEDEQVFARNFAYEIIGGMLDLEPRVWRNPKRETFEAQKSKVLDFGAQWKHFDFTKQQVASSSSSSSSSDDAHE